MAPYIFMLVIALGTTVTAVSEPINVPREKLPGVQDDKIHAGKPAEGFLSKRPTMKELQRIKWDGNKKLMLIETIANHWRNLGTTLGIPEAVLNGYTTKHMRDQEECCREVLQRWLERGSEPKESYPVNWEGLISALEDTGLDVIADDMRQMMTTTVPETKHATTTRYSAEVDDKAGSWEYQTISKNSADLTSSLAKFKIGRKLADQLQDDGVIGDSVRDLAYIAGPEVTERMRVRPIIDAMKEKIKLKKERYYQFRTALLTVLGPDADAVEKYVPAQQHTEL